MSPIAIENKSGEQQDDYEKDNHQNASHKQLPIANCRLPIIMNHRNLQLAIGNWESAITSISPSQSSPKTGRRMGVIDTLVTRTQRVFVEHVALKPNLRVERGADRQ